MRAGRRRPVLLAAGALGALLGLVLSGCMPIPGGGPQIIVDRFGDGVSDPLAIALTGMQPGVDVRVTATARTVAGDYVSAAVFAVPPDGRVELWSQTAVTAAFVKPDPGALLWAMTGPSLSQTELERTWATGDVLMTVTAEQSGHRVAVTQFREVSLGEGSRARVVHVSDLVAAGATSALPGTVQAGTYFAPALPHAQPRPAVLIVDGDDSGASGAFIARRIAEAGFPAFVLPAFGPADQIPGSSALSVEAFDAARTWLASRPGVDPGRIVVYGTSRAEPLALWFAANEPGRVYSAIGAGGPTALQCTSTAGSSLLTSGGEPVPCVLPQSSIARTPILPLSRIPGSILLGCGAADQLLASCDWVHAAVFARGSKLGDEVLIAAGASHDITTPPLLPIGLSDLPPATAQATEDARASFWTLVTAVLERASRP